MADRGTLTLGVATILIVSLFAGAGSLAYFSDTAMSMENMFIAGTFGIVIDGSGTSLPFKAWNIMPGWSDDELHGVKNIGSTAGEVYITAENFVESQEDYWGEPPEPEHSSDVSAEDFSKILFMRIYADIDKDHDYEHEEIIYDGPLYGMKTDRFGIDFGEYICCKFVAYLPTDLDDPLTVGLNEDDNLYQADGVECDIVFYADTKITINP